MPLGSYYIDSQSFLTASAVYTDANLTIKAPAGIYQIGGIYREQLPITLNLGPQITCPNCNKGACGDNPRNFDENNQGAGYYVFEDIEVGTSTGVMQFIFNVGSIPNGIIVRYSGTDYSTIYSINDGKQDGPYYGTTASATFFNFPAAGPYTIPNKEWDGQVDGAGDATNFPSTGTDTTVSPVIGDFSPLVNGNELNMFIPKTAAEPQTIESITIIAPTGSTGDAFQVINQYSCPTTLADFEMSIAARGTAADACLDPVANSYFIGKLATTPDAPNRDIPQVGDVLFANSSAGIPLADVLGAGFFYYEARGGTVTGYLEMDADSQIQTIGTCPP